MTDVLILGTDTDAGKTTFALLWLSLFGDQYEYWKPVETGPSDTATIAALLPQVAVHPAARRCHAPLAPPLAARQEGRQIAAAATIAAARPSPTAGKQLLIETFGGPFSPLNDDELQLELIRRLEAACVLVASSALGAIGRTLALLTALDAEHIAPAAVVLLGPRDDFALEEIHRRWRDPVVVGIEAPPAWDRAALLRHASQNADAMQLIRTAIVRERLQSLPDSRGSFIERDRAAVWHPYTSLGDEDAPLVCVGAEAEFLHLADGRRVIDAISSWWTIQHGHRHPPLMRALATAAEQMDHVLFAGVTHPAAIELAELLLATMPWRGGGRVFYSDNGSTAVEVALKLAYQFWCHHSEPGRTRFVGFEHGYHGDTFGAMAVSRDPVFFGRFEPLLLQADILPLDPQRLDEHLSTHRGEVAAMILEPLVQGAGGMRMHTPETLADIVAVARRHGVLCIIDEVMTGGGRTGTLWAHEAAGVVPDLVCAAKTLAGGMLPLAATLVSPTIVAAFETSDASRTFFHGHSFTAHPLACAVAVENFRHGTEAWGQRAREIEAVWRQEFDALRGEPHIRDVRVRGSIAALELDVPGGYLASIARSLRQRCLREGVFLRPLGPVLYALPPLGTSEASLRRIAAAMKSAAREALNP